MWPDSSETQELLGLARNGDAAARNRLLERHREALRRMIGLRMDPLLRRRLDASDIVQDVLVEADRRLAGYMEQAAAMPFGLWLRHLARDRMVDAHRRHRGAARRSLDREQALPPPTDSNSGLDLAALARDRDLTPAAAATHHELEMRFHAAIAALDTTDREVVLMRHFEQLSNQEAAQALQLSEAAAGMRYLRAMRKLRAALQEPPSQSSQS